MSTFFIFYGGSLILVRYTFDIYFYFCCVLFSTTKNATDGTVLFWIFLFVKRFVWRIIVPVCFF